MRVAGLAWGAADELQWGERERAVDFFDVKGDLQALLVGQALSFHADVHPAMHPGRCARVELGGRVLGHVGELHPKWRQSYDLPSAPVLFELALDGVLARQLPAFEPLPRQQAAMRDLALVVRDHVSHEALVTALRSDPAGLVRQVTLFDIYKPAQAQTGMAADERSLAVRLELLDDAATLTDDRIDQAVAAAVQRAARACGARLRA